MDTLSYYEEFCLNKLCKNLKIKAKENNYKVTECDAGNCKVKYCNEEGCSSTDEDNIWGDEPEEVEEEKEEEKEEVGEEDEGEEEVGEEDNGKSVNRIFSKGSYNRQ